MGMRAIRKVTKIGGPAVTLCGSYGELARAHPTNFTWLGKIVGASSPASASSRVTQTSVFSYNDLEGFRRKAFL